MTTERPACHICGNEGESLTPWPQGGGEMRLCRDCDFVFAWPITDTDPVALYSRAYAGCESQAMLEDYQVRMKRRTTSIRHESVGLRSPAQLRALGWLETNVPKGSTVLDIGCGVGVFMHALRRRGYEAVGVDVAEPVVEVLRHEGFQVWHGTVDTIPKNWAQPAAITCFWVLHHLSAPMAFLSSIRDHWPRSPLLIGCGRPPTVETALPCHYPPRAWGWWTERAITRALTLAHYNVGVVEEATNPIKALPRYLVRAVSPVIWRWPRLRVLASRAFHPGLRLPFGLLGALASPKREMTRDWFIVASPTLPPSRQ